jgi:SH3-like domain-containing protein
LKKSFFAILFSLMIFSNHVSAQDTEGLFGSIASNEVNVRVGPGTQYPISWVYKQKNWPVEAVAKHQGWYKIRDVDGEEGWIYGRFFSKTRYGIVYNPKEQTPVNMYKKRDGRRVILRFEHGSLVRLRTCELDICKVSYGKTKGWMQKKYLLNTQGIPAED